ncbi:dihydroneopterin triphosphate 2'-epimerase [Prolixibacteraceae bacterium JC049]|nr:dihydroneopterin triphosphate 2'-epimerase [Prolixibacteraceae bacterium JC049]
MAKIRIKNLLLRTYIGFKPHELNNKQDVVINIELETDVSEGVKTDDPEGIVNYRTITKEIIKHVQESKYALLESLTQSILDIVMKNEKITWGKVEVDKPHALRFSESVSVELEETRKL